MKEVPKLFRIYLVTCFLWLSYVGRLTCYLNVKESNQSSAYCRRHLLGYVMHCICYLMCE